MIAGRSWCALFPTSVAIEDLIEPFRTNVAMFLSDIGMRGGVIKISATWRPAERAYLMHWCSMIAMGKQDPALVPSMEGVDIQWELSTPQETIQAAKEMMDGYGIVFPPALVSRHTQRRAIDMTITGPLGMSPSALWALGRSFGVIKLESDPPHWSDDGH